MSEIRIGEDAIGGLKTAMGSIAGFMFEVSQAAKSWHGEIRSYVLRPDAIGCGWIGPSRAVQGLNEALFDRLDEFVWKLDQGAENLQAAYDYQANYDEAVAARLNQIAAAIEARSRIEPYDDSTIEA
jgi:hypothetical protein